MVAVEEMAPRSSEGDKEIGVGIALFPIVSLFLDGKYYHVSF